MPLPDDIATVTIVAEYAPLSPTGVERQGYLWFTPIPAVLASTSTGTILLGREYSELADGVAIKEIIACDSADQPFIWHVEEHIAGEPVRSYNIDVPASAGTVHLATLATTEELPDDYAVIVGPQGQKGDQGEPGTDGEPGELTGPAGGDLDGNYPNPTLSAATETRFDPAGSASAAQGAAQTYADGKLAKTANLSDLQSPPTARTNLGLGSSATRAVGTGAGTVAAGDDARLIDSRAPTSHASSHAAGGTDPVTPASIGALPSSGGTINGDLGVVGRLSAGGFYLPMLAPSPRASAWRAPSWMQNFQSGHGWTTSNVGSSTLNDTSAFVRGTQCATITSNGAGGSGNLSRTGQPAIDLTGKALRLLLKVDDTTHVSSINFFVGTGGLSSYFKWKAWNVTASTKMIQSGEWVTVTLQWADVNLAAGSYSISTNGVPSTTSGFTDMTFQVIDDAGGTVTAHLQTVEVIPDTTATFPGGVVSITFDDSWKSVHDYGRPIMDTYGYRGTTYTIAEAVGTAEHLTLDNLRSVQDLSGWEVAGHAYTADAHTARYPTLTAQQVEDEVRNLKAWLVANEFTSDAFAYPGGQFGATTDGVPVDQLVSKYFNTGRSINYLSTTEMHPPAMPRRMRALSSIGSVISASDPANVTKLTGNGGMLDRCQRSGSWLILTFHQIVTTTPTDPVQCSVTDFQTVMAAINSRGTPVLPVGDVIRNYS